MKVTRNYKRPVRQAAELIRDKAGPGAAGHAAVVGGSLADLPGNLPGPFILTADGNRAGPYADLAGAIAAHMAWNTRTPATLWHETPDGRRKVLA